MNIIEDVEVECPYCWESFAISVDTEAGGYETVEDCAVCCRPIAIVIRCKPGEITSLEVSPG